MNEFWLWFSTGTGHILDWQGYDHILYVMALSVCFTVREWRQLLILITAFTIGHSLTLAASVLELVTIRQSWIEALIPLTILLTCAVNIASRGRTRQRPEKNSINYRFNYALALVFGFVHGMGFSYLLKAMLGKQESLLLPLLSFNLGLEAGQVLIVSAMLILSVFLTRFTRIKTTDYAFFVSSAVFGIAFLLFIQRLND